MKKFTAFALLLTVVFNMSGCSNQPANPNGTSPQAAGTTQAPTDEQIAANLFTMDYEDNESQVKTMASNDTFQTVTLAGPLYAGKEADLQPGLKRFRELKLALVDKIMTATNNADTDARAYAAELKVLKDNYVDALGKTLEQNKKMGTQIREMSKTLIEPEVTYTANFALYKSTDPETASPDSVKAFLQYQRVYLTLQNVALLGDDTTNTVGGLLALQYALQNSGDPNMKTIADGIENKAPALVDALAKKLALLQQSAADIDQMLKQIDTAEYDMGQASVQYMQSQLSDLNAKLETLQPNDDLTADDIAFIKNLTAYYGGFADDIKQNLDKIDKTKLLSFSAGTPSTGQQLIPLANAQVVPDTGYGWQAFDMLKSAAKATYNVGKTAGEFTWNAGKTLISGVKTTAGVTLDTMAATTQSVKDIVGGGLNGDSLKQIGQNIKDNFKQVADNYNEGRSGSDVLKTAHDYFEGAEQFGGNLAEGAIEKTLGKGWTSWMAGHVGKLTVNLFTSLGKGITAVANKSSTTGEILEGMLDIGMSFIGGSKVIASGSQMLQGGKQLLKNFGEQGFNFLAKTLWKSDVALLKALREELKAGAKKMTAKELEAALYMNGENIIFKEGIVKELEAAGKKLTAELKSLIGEGAKTVAENATTGLNESLKEFIKESFENSLKGVGDAIIATLGKDLTKYFDNIVANKIDDIIKEFVKEAADNGNIPGLTIVPDIKDLAGRWSNGSMVITDVVVTEEFKQKAKEEGCDYTEVQKQKGKSVPLEILMEPDSATGGNLTIKGSDGKPQIIPFTYEDGVITAKSTVEGASINLNMNVNVENGQIKSSGPMEISYGDGGLKIMADTEASKPAAGQPTPPKAQPPKPQTSPAPGQPATPGGQTPTDASPATNDFANT